MQTHALYTRGGQLSSGPCALCNQRGSLFTRTEQGPGSFRDPPLAQSCMVVRTRSCYHRARDAAEWAAPGPHVECAARISAAGGLVEGWISGSHLYGGQDSLFRCAQYSRIVSPQHTIHFGGTRLRCTNHQHKQWCQYVQAEAREHEVDGCK